MATTMNTIEVALPEGVSASPEEIEALRSIFRVIAAQRFEERGDWPATRHALERDGWSVKWSLQWHVEARRGRELEESCAHTLGEAFASVWRFVGTESETEGTP
jgi:hypothetical protein